MRMLMMNLVLFTFLWSGVAEEIVVDVDTDTDEKMPDIVAASVDLFQEKQNSARPIPAGLLRNAKAIGIIKVTKAGLGVAGARGTGVIVAKTPSGWSAPFAFYQGGGSVGFQAGVDVKKYIYVFNSDVAMRPFTGDGHGKLEAGAEATAGPDTYSETAVKGLPATNFYVYTLSEGAFAGAAVGGQTFGSEKDINRKAYGTSQRDLILGGKIPVPLYAKSLSDALNQAMGSLPIPIPPAPSGK